MKESETKIVGEIIIDEELKKLWDGTPPYEALSQLAHLQPTANLQRKLSTISETKRDSVLFTSFFAYLHAPLMRVVIPTCVTAMVILMVAPTINKYLNPVSDSAQLTEQDLEELVDGQLLFISAGDEDLDQSDQDIQEGDNDSDDNLVDPEWFQVLEV